VPRNDDDLLSLRSCVSLVRLFHQRIKAPIAATPQTLKCEPASALLYSQRLSQLAKEVTGAANGTSDVLLSRLAMTLEEVSEWLAAHAQGDLVAAADALGDRLYLLLGDAVATGMPLPEIFEAVHTSNLSKLPGVTTGMGKGVKGASYRRPELAKLLATEPPSGPQRGCD
jgi:predicted HAD superfamily Cof-like phosphohydrolase